MEARKISGICPGNRKCPNNSWRNEMEFTSRKAKANPDDFLKKTSKFSCSVMIGCCMWGKGPEDTGVSNSTVSSHVYTEVSVTQSKTVRVLVGLISLGTVEKNGPWKCCKADQSVAFGEKWDKLKRDYCFSEVQQRTQCNAFVSDSNVFLLDLQKTSNK